MKRVLSQVMSLLVGGSDILDSIGNRIIIYSAVKWHFDWMDNPAIFCCLAQNVARPVFPICARLRHECNQTMLVFATVCLVAGVEPYDLRFRPTAFHSCDYPLSKISVWKLPGNVLLKLCHSSHVQVLNAHIIMIFRHLFWFMKLYMEIP